LLLEMDSDDAALSLLPESFLEASKVDRPARSRKKSRAEKAKAAKADAAKRRGGLLSLYGVGPRRAGLLKHVGGIRRVDDLLTCDLAELGWELHKYDGHVTMAVLEGMRVHAQSYVDGRALLFGAPPDLGSSYLVFDLEYEPSELIWIIGMLLVDGERVEHRYLWADDAEAERRNLESLAEVMREREGAPLVTWAGSTADLPQLLGAATRQGIDDVFEGIFERHVDLFARCEDCLRLPIPGLGLDAVSSFFGCRKESPIPDGLEALRIYGDYRKAEDEATKERLRSDLVVYNHDDLRAVVAIERALRALAGEADEIVATDR
jgi:predicted RecB family nuclease